MAIRKTKEQFILEAIEIHGDKYDYSQVVYVNYCTKVNIYCKKHKEFFPQTPICHLRGKECCDKCVREARAKTKEQFISEAVKIHGDKYDYLKVVYVNNITHVNIYCKKHKEFFPQTPICHLRSKECCDKCVREARAKTKEQFILEAIKIHGDKYDYSKVVYVNSYTNVSIYCKKHKEFFPQTPHTHIQGSDCDKCAREARIKTKEQFILEAIEIHGDKYDYSQVVYVNYCTKVNIYCKKHKEFFPQTPQGHLQGKGCRKCNASKGEEKIRKHLESLGYKEGIHFKSEFITKKDRPDFVLIKEKKLIEFNGEQHYIPKSFGSKKENAAEANLELNIKSDYWKIKRSLKKNWPLLIIGYWDLERVPEIINDFLADKEPTFSEPPAKVKKYENKRMEIRRKLGIEGPEILCGVIRPVSKRRRSRKAIPPTQPV